MERVGIFLFFVTFVSFVSLWLWADIYFHARCRTERASEKSGGGAIAADEGRVVGIAARGQEDLRGELDLVAIRLHDELERLVGGGGNDHGGGEPPFVHELLAHRRHTVASQH